MVQVLSPYLLPLVMPNIHNQLTIKLTPTNYLLWQTQLFPILKGYDLAHHIDGYISPPPALLDDDQPNPTYNTWFWKDQLVLSWIVNSLSLNILFLKLLVSLPLIRLGRFLATVYTSGSRTLIR